MMELFDEQWMQKFKDEWNRESGITDELEKINFNSAIAYGFDDEECPRGTLLIENGRVTSVSDSCDSDPNWDLRASKENWEKWFVNPPGMMTLGMAYTSRKLRFKKGDYAAMIKDPRMAGPFIKSFAVMGRV